MSNRATGVGLIQGFSHLGVSSQEPGTVVYRPHYSHLAEYLMGDDVVAKVPDTNEVIDRYLVRKADGGGSTGYLTVRERKLRFFARQYPQLPTSAEILRAYLRQFRTDTVSTRADQWKVLADLYKFAAGEYGITSPMVTVDKPRFKKKPGQRLSREQAKELLTFVRSDLERALLVLYFGLRFRRIEAARLCWGDIKDDYLVVKGKERTEELPLLPVFRDILLKLRDSRGPEDAVFRMNADTLAYHIEQVFKRSGVSGVRGSPHTLRNTAGALWSTFGGDWTSNRQLLRHSAKTMTDHYSPLTIDELRVKDERYNPMLCLMRELGQVPDPATTYLNTSSVRVTEATDLLPQLLDQLEQIGETARQLKQALGSNGHKAQKLEEIKEYLQRQASK